MLSPSSGRHSLRMSASWSASEAGAPLTGARSRSSRLMALGALDRNQGPGGEVLRQFLRYLPVDGLLCQRLVFKQLFELLERLVAIGRPQQQQFFERGGAVRAYCRSCR